MAAAIAVTLPPGTNRPELSDTNSGMPPRANARTGVPQDIASATTSPYGSSHAGVTNDAAAPPTSRANR